MADKPQSVGDLRLWAEAELLLERAVKVEMYDVTTLAALKNACQKLGDRGRIVAASKRLAVAYTANGMTDKAVSEYQFLAKEAPDDNEVTQALRELKRGEKKSVPPPPSITASRLGGRVTEGNKRLGQFLIEEHLLKSNEVWLLLHLLSEVNAQANGHEPAAPFLFLASARNGIPIENLLVAVADRFHLPYVPLEVYEMEEEVKRQLPHDLALKHSVLAFDRIGRKTLVATANPFDEEVRNAVQKALPQGVLWYVGSPADIVFLLRESDASTAQKA